MARVINSQAVLAANLALLYTNWMLEARESPPVMSLILASRKAVVSLPVDAQLVGLGHSLINGLVDDLVVHGILLGNGVRHQHTAAETHVLLDIEGLGQLGGGVDAGSPP